MGVVDVNGFGGVAEAVEGGGCGVTVTWVEV